MLFKIFDKRYKYFKKRKKGKKFIEHVRGSGYYLPISQQWTFSVLNIETGLNVEPPKIIGRTEEFKLESGKIGVYELVGYETYSNPRDMVKEARYMFLGYKDEKPINECTWEEFKTIYLVYFKKK